MILSLLKKAFLERGVRPETAAEIPTEPGSVAIRAGTRYGLALNRVSRSPYYRPYTDSKHPYGFYQNRPIIGEGTKIIGGIFLSAQPAEALVVDECYDMLRPIVASFRSRTTASLSGSLEDELATLEDIFNLADRAFEWAPDEIKVFNRIHGIHDDSKAALDLYIKEKIGVSRHKVLLAAYLIEKLKEDGRLTGVQTIPGPVKHEDGNDEVLVYTFQNGAFAAFDPRPCGDSQSAPRRDAVNA